MAELTSDMIWSVNDGELNVNPDFNDNFNKTGRSLETLGAILASVVASAGTYGSRENYATVARHKIVNEIKPPLVGEDVATVVGPIWDAVDGHYVQNEEIA